jgi:EAL and modified HD-GYP domain-containing signal transduction protein
VLTDALLGIGLDSLTGSSRAFINFTRPLLLNDAALLLPAESVVIELREDIAVDAEVVEACQTLQAKGYTLALDDFVEGSDAEALLPYVRFVKLDVLDPPSAIWQPVARPFAGQAVAVVAERVETEDVVAQALDVGCSLFQGFYFCKPATQSASRAARRWRT